MSDTSSGAKSWHGRLTAEADAQTAALVACLDVDRRLWEQDLAGSRGHARMLHEVGLLTAGELDAIGEGLDSIAADLRAGKLEMPDQLEDIHMVVESALIDRTGDPGRKLHTGRSRNDQIALDLRLWARQAVDDMVGLIRELQRAFVAQAADNAEIVIPAYTHLQRAQPILAGHGLLAYVEMLQRDVERLADARKRIDVCPLGCGAVAGTSLPLDRKRTAELLGFSAVARNSVDATSDRDFLAELCFDCCTVAGHLSRWAEDWIIYSTTEFGIIELHDSYCTSSSMMPQKKNPDTLELIRGKSAMTMAQLVGLLTLVKGVPMAYARDLQDDKRFAFAATDATSQALAVARGIVATARFDRDKIAGSLDAGFLDATSLAEYFTGKGVPFRQAHQIVGRLVAKCEQAGTALAKLPVEAFRDACPAAGDDVYEHLGPSNVVGRYQPFGAAGAGQLREQLDHWRQVLS